MNKFLFSAYIALLILGCSERSEGDMPCLLCDSEDYRKCGYEWYNAAKSDLRCYGNVVETKCGSAWYDDKNTDLSCRSNIVETRCGTGSSFYNPATQFCQSPNVVLPLCGGNTYTVTEQCCGSSKYTTATEFCSGNSVYNKCSGQDYIPSNQRCENNVIETKCGSAWYNDKNTDLSCRNNAVETRCGTGSSFYNPATEFCIGNSVHDKCGGSTYSPETQFCQYGTNEIKSLCGTQTYSSTEFCQSPNVVKPLCGTKTYAATEFCQYGTNAVKPFCGTETYLATEGCCGSSKYTIATHFCVDGTPSTSKGTFTDSRDSKEYEYITIGTQTWMAENLNYDADGSKCHGDNTGGDSQNRCDTYGRLYDWSTAMGFDVACNSTSCSGQVNAKHKGICPSGWHIPSNADWDELMTAVGGSSTAGTHLKATSGWSGCGPSGSGNSYLCEDTHGFSALPGGYGSSGGSFYDVGYDGDWWSSSEDYSSYAYYRLMRYYDEDAYWGSYDKYYLFSVRCLQD